MPLPIAALHLREQAVVGEFTIIGKLAEGGMGIVYSAEHPKIGKKAEMDPVGWTIICDL